MGVLELRQGVFVYSYRIERGSGSIERGVCICIEY